MSLVLPAHVAERIRPVPSDFSPAFEDHPGYVRWAATLDVIPSGPMDVEIGFSKAGGDLAIRRERLRQSAWQAMELARLGQRGLLGYSSVTRHNKS